MSRIDSTKRCLYSARPKSGQGINKFMTPDSSGEHPHTTTPLREATASALQLAPEFVDFRGLDRLFGIKRSLGYALLSEGLIESVSLRRRGQLLIARLSGS